MAECPYCGAGVMPGYYQCPNCGSPLSPSQTAAQAAVQAAPAPQPFYTQQPMPPAQQSIIPGSAMPSMSAPAMQSYAPTAMPTYAEPVVPVSSWMGYILLCLCMPVIGAIITATSPKEQNVKNFGKALLALELIGGALLFGFILLMLMFGYY
ncbi:MAG: zinc ribbon domain-containing protein [Oscillospiraceae bacterium]|nr:zinc ribbon domain-containing protein [Oscillospiraceae bacterium]